MTDVMRDTPICGCGRVAKYMVKDSKWACNKAMRCPTRDELAEMVIQLRTDLDKANADNKTMLDNGCFTGDCPHWRVSECVDSIEEMIRESIKA